MNPSGVRRANKKKVPIIFIEDADEFLRPDAKASAGQALARLLNLTDGMLGQGLALLLVITTNEPLTGFHPAVGRRPTGWAGRRRWTASELRANSHSAYQWCD